MNAMVSAIVMATLVVGPFYLAHGLQLDGASIGLVMAVGPLVAAFTGAPAGRLVDSTGAWPVTVIGIVSLIAGTVTLAVASPWLDATGYAGALALMTGGYACFQAANNTTAMTSAPGAERGVVSGLVNLSRNLGLLTGTAAMGSIFSQASGLAKGIALDTIAVTQGMQATFGAAAILGLVVLILAVKFRPHADQT
jgi:MFS family permease